MLPIRQKQNISNWSDPPTRETHTHIRREGNELKWRQISEESYTIFVVFFLFLFCSWGSMSVFIRKTITWLLSADWWLELTANNTSGLLFSCWQNNSPRYDTLSLDRNMLDWMGPFNYDLGLCSIMFYRIVLFREGAYAAFRLEHSEHD